jgi:hypothetical protein
VTTTAAKSFVGKTAGLVTGSKDQGASGSCGHLPVRRLDWGLLPLSRDLFSQGQQLAHLRARVSGKYRRRGIACSFVANTYTDHWCPCRPSLRHHHHARCRSCIPRQEAGNRPTPDCGRVSRWLRHPLLGQDRYPHRKQALHPRAIRSRGRRRQLDDVRRSARFVA